MTSRLLASAAGAEAATRGAERVSVVGEEEESSSEVEEVERKKKKKRLPAAAAAAARFAIQTMQLSSLFLLPHPAMLRRAA